ncbi:hypothetical protein D3C80_1644670 [compost metagenome]
MSFVPFDIDDIRSNARRNASAFAAKVPGSPDERRRIAASLEERLVTLAVELRERDEIVFAHPAARRHPDLARLLTDGTRLPAATVIERLFAHDTKAEAAA